MLNSDDIERILDVADEFGMNLEETDVEKIWSKCLRTKGVSDMPLPIDRKELADMLQEAVACVG